MNRIDRLYMEMIRFYQGDPRHIQHFVKVHSFSRLIGQAEGLDEEQIRVIQEQYEYQVNLEKRKEDVKRLIEQQGKLTEEIIASVNACEKLSQVEDIYRPYQ